MTFFYFFYFYFYYFLLLFFNREKGDLFLGEIALLDLFNAGELNVENIDVFCEKGVFEVEHSQRILEVCS